MNANTYIASAIILGICLIIASFVFGNYLVQSRQPDRSVQVKGLSEREVVADRAWWSINANYGASSFEDIQKRIENHERMVRKFLNEQDFKEEEIAVDNINIYQNSYQGAVYPYNLDIRISVSTSEFEKVQKAASQVAKLIDKGVILSGDKWASGPKYYFTKFSDLKREMLAEATIEARKAADEFASNSNSVVGEIKYANQGIFQILPGNRTNESEEFFPDKIVRVVSTINFYLK